MTAIDPNTAEWADEYPFRSNWHELPGGLRMHYVDEGPRDAPVLLMVHGNPTWSFYYRNLIKAFRGEFRCIVPDHVGCGLSDKPDEGGYEYTLARRIADLKSLVESLQVEAFTLVLHDWGGAIGMGVAVEMPAALQRIVVFNTAAFRHRRIPFSINICKIPGFGSFAIRGLNGFVQAAQIRAIYDRSKLGGPIRAAYLAPYDSWENRVAVYQFVQDIPMKPEHPTWDTLGRVQDGLAQFSELPVLIVWGDDDFCFTADFRREWERRFPHAESHPLADAGHFVVEDATDKVVGWMADFLART